MNEPLIGLPTVANDFLRCSIQSFFCDERYLLPVINKLHQKGYNTLGDIAEAKSEQTIFAGIRTTKKNRERFRSALREGFIELSP